MEKTLARLKALSDSNRLRTAAMLLQRPLCVCEILEVLDIAGGTLSNHLRILENAGLIKKDRSGKWLIYRISDQESENFIRQILPSPKDDPLLYSDIEKLSQISPKSCAAGRQQ